MRVVAGRHRGRRLATPSGPDVRPTSERVREALFDVLAHNPYGPGGATLPRGAAVVDAFAGSGALGFEALSRGATHVTFIDDDAEALRFLRRNAHTLDDEEAVTILSRDATLLGPAPSPCALAFLDPPYRSGLAGPALAELAKMGWLTGGALSVIELAAREPFDPPAGFEAVDDRRYGDTRVVFLTWSRE